MMIDFDRIEQLVIAAQTGSQRAIEDLCAFCKPRLHRYFLLKTEDFAHAEDLVQETLLSAFLHITKLDTPRTFPKWVATIAWRALRQWNDVRHRDLATKAGSLDALRTNADGDEVSLEAEGTPADAVERGIEEQAAIRSLLRLCTPEQERVLLLDAQGYDRATIARMEGVPESTLKMRAFHGKRKARKAYMDTESAGPSKLRGGPRPLH